MTSIINLVSSEDEEEQEDGTGQLMETKQIKNAYSVPPVQSSTDSEKIEIKVRRGDTNTDVLVKVSPHEKCGSLKKIIFETQNVEPDRQRILFAGKEIRNNSTLNDYNILDGFVVTLIVRQKQTIAAATKNGDRKRKRRAKTSPSLLDQTQHNSFRNNTTNNVIVLDSSDDEAKNDNNTNDNADNTYDYTNATMPVNNLHAKDNEKFLNVHTTQNKMSASVTTLDRERKNNKNSINHTTTKSILKRKDQPSKVEKRVRISDNITSCPKKDNTKYISTILKDFNTQSYQTIAPQYHEMIVSILDNNNKDLERVIDQLSRLTRATPPQLPGIDLLTRLFEWASGIKSKSPARTSSTWIFLKDIITRFPCYVTNMQLDRASSIERMLSNLGTCLKNANKIRKQDLENGRNRSLRTRSPIIARTKRSENIIDNYCRKVIPAFDFLNSLIEKDFLVAKYKDKLDDISWYNRDKKIISIHECANGDKKNKNTMAFTGDVLVGKAFKRFWVDLNEIFKSKDDMVGSLVEQYIIKPHFNCLLRVHKTMCSLSHLIDSKKIQVKKHILKPFCDFLTVINKDRDAHAPHAITKFIGKVSDSHIRGDFENLKIRNGNIGIKFLTSHDVHPIAIDEIVCNIPGPDTKHMKDRVDLIIDNIKPKDKRRFKSWSQYEQNSDTGDFQPITGSMDSDFPPIPNYKSSYFNARVPCKRFKTSKKDIVPVEFNINKITRKSQLTISASQAEGLLPWRDKSGRLKFLAPNIRYAIRRLYKQDEEEKYLKYAQIYREILRNFWSKLCTAKKMLGRDGASALTKKIVSKELGNNQVPFSILNTSLEQELNGFNIELEAKTIQQTLGMTKTTKDSVLKKLKKIEMVTYEDFVWTIEEYCGKEVGSAMHQYVKNGGQLANVSESFGGCVSL